MANVPGLHVGGTGTSAVQSQGAIPVVASGGKAFAFSAVGTSGYFLRSGGTGVPTFFNLFGTTNTMVRQHFTAVSGLSLRLYHDGISDGATMDFVSQVAGGNSGYLGFVGSANHLYLQNSLAAGDLILRTVQGNLIIGWSGSFTDASLMTGIISIQEALLPPGDIPVGKGRLWVEAGALKYQGTSGRVTEVAGP